LTPLDYLLWDILQELVYKRKRELFANLKDLQYVIMMSTSDSQNQKSRIVVEKTSSSSGKAE